MLAANTRTIRCTTAEMRARLCWPPSLVRYARGSQFVSRCAPAGRTRTVLHFSCSLMLTIRVRSSSGPYAIHCGKGALSRAASLFGKLTDSTGTFVVSSPNVWRHWGRPLSKLIPGAPNRVLFDDRERAKRLATVEEIIRKLVRAGADRRAVIVAVGGGVVGDVVGFAAAMYLRGVRLVHIPTTVVAQVDSAIGGKTGVDLPEGKNLVGAFYPPKLVIADPTFLRTL